MYTYRWSNMHTICNNYSECIKFYTSSFRCLVRYEVWFPEICEIEIDYYLKCNILNVSSVNSSINILNKRWIIVQFGPVCLPMIGSCMCLWLHLTHFPLYYYWCCCWYFLLWLISPMYLQVSYIIHQTQIVHW